MNLFLQRKVESFIKILYVFFSDFLTLSSIRSDQNGMVIDIAIHEILGWLYHPLGIVSNQKEQMLLTIKTHLSNKFEISRCWIQIPSNKWKTEIKDFHRHYIKDHQISLKLWLHILYLSAFCSNTIFLSLLMS